MEDKRFAEYLLQYHLGESRAATSRELEITFSASGKGIRDAVNRLRRNEVPIASSASGYFWGPRENPAKRFSWGEEEQGSGRSFRRQAETELSGLCDDDEQEIDATIAHLTHRISGIAAAIRGLKQSREKFDTTQLRIPESGGGGP